MAGGLVGGENVYHVIGVGEEIFQVADRMDWDGFVAARFVADGMDIHVEWLEQFDEAASDGAETDQEGGLPDEKARMGTDVGLGPTVGAELVGQRGGKIAGGGEHEGKHVLGTGFIEDG